MRTDDSLLASWLPRHRVLHLSGRNVLLGLILVLAGLTLLGWCLYWLNNAQTYSYRSNYSAQDESHYKLAAVLLLPAGLGLVSLGISRVLRFRLLLRLTKLLFGISALGWGLVALFLLGLLSLTTKASLAELALGLVVVIGVPALLVSGCLATIRKLRHWLRQTPT